MSVPLGIVSSKKHRARSNRPAQGKKALYVANEGERETGRERTVARVRDEEHHEQKQPQRGGSDSFEPMRPHSYRKICFSEVGFFGSLLFDWLLRLSLFINLSFEIDRSM
mmetsp:Transcript_234/g.581  ORF Transcript_234/g.581 Transcript_234/m.581 type:complete len:110 (-) Transcript_234:2745-3074(-)